ncbi:MAG: hypothetical protein LUD07_11010 [Clostridiales bacterium]|nr:hypothetical protein [Clostridiales bacterium]
MNTQQNQHWQKDPRLASMDPEKIRFLTDFSDRLRSLPKDKIMPFLLLLRQEAEQKHIRFTDQEALLIASVLSTDMTAEQKHWMETMRSVLQRRS